MAQELLQPKLKPLVDGALVTDIIRRSSLGIDSHRTAATELVLKRFIHGRRRVFTGAKKSLWSDSIPHPKSEATNVRTRHYVAATITMIA
jgi:hypothetical protein